MTRFVTSAGPAAETGDSRDAARKDSGEFRHIALFYRDGDEYLAEVSTFVLAALGRGDPVLVAVPRCRAALLTEVLGTQAARVAFVDMTEAGRNPGRIMHAVRSFMDGYPGRRVSAVGEPAWPARSHRELLEVAKHEALSNVAFAGMPLTSLCPHDVRGLPARVLAEAEQTHPLLAPGAPCASQAYLGPGRIPSRCLEPLPEPPPGSEIIRYGTNLHQIRALIADRATQAGLSADRTADLVIAANELVSNTLRHTGHGGTLRIWRTPDELACETTDRGLIADPLAGRLRPDDEAGGGLGLWLVNQVCDLVETRTGQAGTVIRLHMNLRS